VNGCGKLTTIPFSKEAILMLVLSRKQDSAVHIGSDIMVKVLSVKRHAVTLGIDAPDNVRILRDELVPQLDQQQQAPTINQSNAGMRIVLVVEDDPGHAKLIRKALCQHQGTMVTVAGTAQSAMDALGTQVTSSDEMIQPDLVMLDLGLPDGSGLDVLRMIRSVPELRSTPVVVLSSNDDEDVLNQCIESGANAFVPKSAGYDEFRAQVSRVGRFWAGDCFARRSFSHRSDNNPNALSDEAAATEADGFEEYPAITDRAKRILLADDDAGHATLIKRALRRANIDCTVDVVHNGVEAIDYLFGQGDFADRQPTALPDLMLLDLNMPEMNGLQVLQVLQNARNRGGRRLTLPPVVVLTSSDENADVNDSYRLGAQSFIRKPADYGRFAYAVQQTTQYWLGLNESRSGEPSRRMKVPR
jgi:carbon storage regulator CsrA